MHPIRHILKRLVACATLAWVGGACADTVTITFTSAQPVAMPLSPWLVVAIAVSIALAALAVFRRKGSQRFFMLGVGLLIAVGGLIVEKNVTAGPPATPLVTSPFAESFSCTGSVNQAFTSGTGGSITLTGVTDDGNPFGTTLTGGTTCTAGTILTPTSTCQVVTTVAPC
jgi:hypothetical protein